MKFDVQGPYPFEGDDISDAAQQRRFWEQTSNWANAIGCYVFGMRTGGGMKPWYVGKTENGFRGEIFQPHKIVKYQKVIHGYERGTPIFFLFPKLTEKNRLSTSGGGIGFLEDLLIYTGIQANEHLTNISKTSVHRKMTVPGLIGTTLGAPTQAVVGFKRLFNL